MEMISGIKKEVGEVDRENEVNCFAHCRRFE